MRGNLVKRVIFTKSVREVALPTAVFVTEAIFAVIIDRTTPYLHHVSVPDIALTVIGTAISIVLAFRVNAAYGRWWEARTLWGTIVNASRSIARQALAVSRDSDSSAAFAKRVIDLQIAYVRIFCAQLGGRDVSSLIHSSFHDTLRTPMETRENVAIAVLTEVAGTIHTAVKHKLFDTVTAARMDFTLTELTNAQGGCERIKLTPLPMQFSVLTETFVYIYALLLPLALADSLGITLPFVSGIITFTFLALSNIGKNLEHPFAGRFYDISTVTITNGIEKVLRSELAAILMEAGDSTEREIYPIGEVVAGRS